MSTLAEIEAAADTLPPNEKQELLLFLAARLRAQAAPPPPLRELSGEEIADWIRDDEDGMRRFRGGQFRNTGALPSEVNTCRISL